MSFDPKSVLPITYSKSIELRTNLSIDECKNRIIKNTVRDHGFFCGFDYHEFAAQVDTDTFNLRKNEGRNSWMVRLAARFESQVDGTHIFGSFSILDFAEPLMFLMLVVLSIFLCQYLSGRSLISS